ncbi:Ig-like domain-containing protein [Streptomyces sp. ODS28]|uniref:L,D-transpeptidase n=1 Tax=Streptomyces sp. ODS28 TaxID=3136688 RepID=UPI0031E7571E
MNHWSNTSRRRIALSGALVLAPLAGLTGCGGTDADPLASPPYDASNAVAVSAGSDAKSVDPAKPLQVSAKGEGEKLTDVIAVDAAGRFVNGELSADGSRWHSTSPLAAGVEYTVRASTENEDGEPGRRTLNFRTKPADQKKLSVTFGPDSGTYGVGQPLTAELSHKVKDPAQRRLVERGLRVESQPQAEGSWYWVDSQKLHFRPKAYWPAHATVRVSSKLAGMKIRDGLYAAPSKPLKLRTGDRVEALADAGTHQLTLKRNGKVVQTDPITTGKAGFSTRTGTKVVLGQESFVRMRSSTIGVAESGSEGYNLPVHWATRLTDSGEYVHAAPWSVGSQGSANVSHGCTGMSTGNAHAFFSAVRPGDLVTHTNTGGEKMPTFGNGFGDWNMSWKEWQKGSALYSGENGSEMDKSGRTNQTQQAAQARLRPEL